MNNCIEYVSKQNGNYIKIDKIIIQNVPTYLGVHYNLLTQVIVDVDILGIDGVWLRKKTFLNFFLPTLVDDMFFILNENYFVPTIYILDKPIVIKKKSIKLTSIFNSVTIYDKLVTFMGNNIPATYFLDLFLSDMVPNELELKQKLIKIFKISPKTFTESDLLTYFGNMFKCDQNRLIIQQCFNGIFFDDYTKILYQQCYNLDEKDLTIPNLLQIGVDNIMNNDENMFINLSYKRLVFMEIILSPIFQRIANIANQSLKGFRVSEINMDQFELIKHFYLKLHNKFLYDNVNAFDTLVSHKTHLLTPNVENAPAIIANLHSTHFKRICPISVSSQNPGETVYTLADAKCDIFGNFYNV